MSSPRVLITRASEDARHVARATAVQGYEPVCIPLIERIWHVDAVATAARNHPRPDVVMLTSALSAEVVAAAAPQTWGATPVAVVGPATGRRAATLGMVIRTRPERATGADLVDALGPVAGLTIAYPRADLAGSELAETLVSRGAHVVDVVAYRNQLPRHAQSALRAALPVDATPLFSGSAAKRLQAALGDLPTRSLGVIIAIGPSTARAAREAGLPVHQIANPHTLNGMLDALNREVQPF